MDTGNLQAKAREAGTLLKAMGNERRLLILCHLANEEKSVGDLEAAIGISQSALSQHLARLRRDGLVRTRRQAQTIFYSIDSVAAAMVMTALEDHWSAKRKQGSCFTHPSDETGTISACP